MSDYEPLAERPAVTVTAYDPEGASCIGCDWTSTLAGEPLLDAVIEHSVRTRHTVRVHERQALFGATA